VCMQIHMHARVNVGVCVCVWVGWSSASGCVGELVSGWIKPIHDLFSYMHHF